MRRAATPGQFVAFAGSDMARGETVLRRGQQISPREIGILAACSIAEIPVVRRPKVAVLSTGDELVLPGTPLPPAGGQATAEKRLWPAVPVMVGMPVSMKCGHFKKIRIKSGSTNRGRTTCSSVVPLPRPPVKFRKTVDLPFSKHGVILAKSTSPSAK